MTMLFAARRPLLRSKVFIFITALIIRLIYIIQLKSTIFYSRFLLDEAFYDSWARSIASGNWLGARVFDALPLYPYFLGIVYRLFGHNLFIPRLIGITLSSFSCVLIYYIAKKFFNRGAGIIAGLIACFYGPFIFYNGLLVPATMAIFLYLLSLWVLLKLRDKPTFFRFFSFGLMVGLAGLVRPGILLFLPVVLIWVIRAFKGERKTFIGALIALVGALVVISPVTLRNYLVSGDIVFLTSHSGINFYIGNNKDADARFKPPQWARSNIRGLQVDTKTMAEKESGRPLKDSEVSRFYFNKGIRFIRGDPAGFLRLLGRKAFLFINRQELFDVAHYRVHQEHIPILKFPFIGFLLVGSLGLAGIFVGISRWKKIAPLYLFVFTYTVSVLAYFVNSRYRLPFAMLMVIFAGFVISLLFEKLREKRYVAASSVVILVLVISGFISLPTGIKTASAGYSNLGNIYIVAGEWDKAIAAFNKAIEFEGTDPKPHNDMGYIYIMLNRLKEAKESLLTSLSKNPLYPFAHINLGLLHEKRADFESAEREYKEAIRLNPNIAEAHNNLANIYEQTNRRWQAIEEYKTAIKLNPASAKAHYNLGVIYGREGKPDKAKQEFEKAVQLDSDFTPAQKALSYFKD